MQLRLLKLAALSTLQDQGRWSSRAQGVPVGGTMDTLAARLANRVLGNPDTAPVVEIGNGYFAAVAEVAGRIAYVGSGGLWIDGRNMLSGRAHSVSAGAHLEIKPGKWGNYHYLAVRDGWQADAVLQSASTCLAAGFGGLEGRPLRAGDVLNARPEATGEPISKYGVSMRHFGAYLRPPEKETLMIRVLPGPECHLWSTVQQTIFTQTDFEISRECNRMGIRLTHTAEKIQDTDLTLAGALGMLSVGVCIGAIQVPPGAQPIVLCADAQTTGGYPRIAQVAAVDMPTLVQAPPGSKVFFQWIDLSEAEYLYLQRERNLQELEKLLLFCK